MSHKCIINRLGLDIFKFKLESQMHMLRLLLFLDEFWVSMQSSGDAVVFFCLERASGRCSKSRVELLSQDNTPVNFHKLKTFTEANEKHICQRYDMYVDQRGGKPVIQRNIYEKDND